MTLVSGSRISHIAHFKRTHSFPNPPVLPAWEGAGVLPQEPAPRDVTRHASSGSLGHLHKEPTRRSLTATGLPSEWRLLQPRTTSSRSPRTSSKEPALKGDGFERVMETRLFAIENQLKLLSTQLGFSPLPSGETTLDDNRMSSEGSTALQNYVFQSERSETVRSLPIMSSSSSCPSLSAVSDSKLLQRRITASTSTSEPDSTEVTAFHGSSERSSAWENHPVLPTSCRHEHAMPSINDISPKSRDDESSKDESSEHIVQDDTVSTSTTKSEDTSVITQDLRPKAGNPMLRRSNTTQSAMGALMEGTVVKPFNMLMGRFTSRSARAENLWNFLEEPESSRGATIYARGMFMFILLTVCMPLSQTLDPAPLPDAVAVAVEMTFDALFMMEVLIRWSVCPSYYGFLRSPHTMLDLCLVGPLILRAYTLSDHGLGSHDVTQSVLLCVVPVLRLLKALRAFPNLTLVYHALSIAQEALTLPLFLLLVLTLVFSTLFYMVESRDNIETMPHAMWLVVVTVSTVGYGDTTPRSWQGKVIASLLCLTGVLYMAMPLTIVGQAFSDTWQKRDQIMATQRMRQRLLQWGITVDDLHALFQRFARDGSGELNLEEFQELVSQMRLGIPARSVTDLFIAIDTDKGGTIDVGEFVEGIFAGGSSQRVATPDEDDEDSSESS